MSLCPSNVGLHKPFFGPLHKADSGNLQSKGILPQFPSPTPPSPGLTVTNPLDAASPPPNPYFWTDTWHIWKPKPSCAGAHLGVAGLVVLQVPRDDQASPMVARLRQRVFF